MPPFKAGRDSHTCIYLYPGQRFNYLEKKLEERWNSITCYCWEHGKEGQHAIMKSLSPRMKPAACSVFLVNWHSPCLFLKLLPASMSQRHFISTAGWEEADWSLKKQDLKGGRKGLAKKLAEKGMGWKLSMFSNRWPTFSALFERDRCSKSWCP